MAEPLLLSANTVAASAVFVLGLIVAWDAYWLTRQRTDTVSYTHLRAHET